jgi:hypothetical protein
MERPSLRELGEAKECLALLFAGCGQMISLALVFAVSVLAGSALPLATVDSPVLMSRREEQRDWIISLKLG